MAPLESDSVRCAHDRLDSVHGVLYCLGYVSWALFMDIVKRKKKRPRNLGRHKFGLGSFIEIVAASVNLM